MSPRALVAATLLAACSTPSAGDLADDPEATLALGEEVYEAHCARCHGPGGRGDGPDGAGLRFRPFDFVTGVYEYKSTPGDALPTDDDLERTLVRGVIAEGMPSFAMLAPAERQAVIQYIKSLADLRG
jgi:mono/diheme cytochrome c family protein